MKRKTLTIWTLSIALALGFTSCQDTCLTDGSSNNPGDDTEQNDALAQKYQALSTLLGALADVDSLPSNWNSKDYTVAPTVGLLKDEAEPHIRYVSTTSQAEADRIYRSYLSKDVSTTPSDDSWQMDGIGSMQFHLENEANHFATLRVNVQQLPALEEIRFVSDDYLGNNGWIAPKGCFYSFGDVVMQDVVGADDGSNTHTPTLWVCVRPCSKNPNRRQSHWCTFQLVPAGKGSLSNYLEVGSAAEKSYLPTKLAYNKSDAERMIQNFFNVLRIMAEPSITRNTSYTGIDDIPNTNDQASFSTLRTTSFMWDYLSLWNKNFNLSDGSTVRLFKQEKLANQHTLKSYLGSTSEAGINLNAYYYGYTKNIFSKGDYTAYNLYLKTADTDLFREVKKQTGYVKLSEPFDFSELEKGARPIFNFYTDESAGKSAYQFIVKYRTGAELEGYSHSTNDVDPSKSFEERTANRIKDLLVSDIWKKKEAYTTYKDKNGETQTLLPFFSIGDRVTSRLEDGQVTDLFFNFCVRNAYEKFQTIDKSWKTKALFIGYGGSDMRCTPTEADIKAALYRMLQAALIFDNEGPSTFGEDYADYYTQYEEIKEVPTDNPLSRRNYQQSLFVLHQMTSKFDIFGKFSVERKDNSRVAKFTARIGTDYYTLELTRTGQGKGNIHDSYRLIKEENYQGRSLQPLYFYTYEDKYGMHEDYSLGRTLVSEAEEERDFLKPALADDLKAFLENCQ